MKKFIIAMVVMKSAFAAPLIIPSPVEHLYIPEGFDNNDSVEVVVSGSFPNTCYSRNQVEVKYNQDIIDISITALVPDESMKTRSFCADVIVPFKEVVSLGNLAGGQYQIRVNSTYPNGLSDVLSVKEASSSAIDDNVYGSIEWVEQKTPGDYVLHGISYSSCVVLDKIKVVSNKKDTLSILPIMKQVSEFCPMKGVPVTYPVSLDFSDLKIKKPLLHVRTLDGKSVNKIVDLDI